MKLSQLGAFRIRKHHVPHICAGLFALVLLLGMAGPMVVTPHVSADQIALRTLKISDSTAAATNVTYDFSFTTINSGPIGSIVFTICNNYMFQASDPCTSPPGFSASSAALNSSSGVTDFSLIPPASPNVLILERPAALPIAPQALSYEFTGITNPSNIDTIYVRITTHSSLDGTGPEIDYGHVLATTNENIEIVTEVPPYLLFCTGLTIVGFNCGTAEGSQINFGELSITTTRVASSQMLASTNAPYGYSITLAGSTMTAGNNVIPAMVTTGPSRIGTSQFGLNARQNTIPESGSDPDGPGLTMPDNGYEVPNQFKFNSGDIITSSASPDDYRKMTISYIVNRSTGQEPGRYVATISYIALANF